eukprot:TRINITY_DN10310_c0_g1_i1.p1 TRINITY_DN10310_c0_g1~~TRINITY_DN10310_c0_g1_i1.p1  ORF type:complete len:1026 (+),score=188.98 TRINITY_DN10310_c0_g1_i1:98-3175(+)
MLGVGRRAPYDHRLETIRADDFGTTTAEAQTLLISALNLPAPSNFLAPSDNEGVPESTDILQEDASRRSALDSQDQLPPTTAYGGSTAAVPFAVVSPSAASDSVFKETAPNKKSNGGSSSAVLSRKRKRVSPVEEEESKWQKLEEMPGGGEILARRPTHFYQVQTKALLSPSDSVGLDVWPHNTNTIKVDLRYANIEDALPTDAPTPASYLFRIFESVGDQTPAASAGPDTDVRVIICAINVDVLPSEGLPRWRPGNANHFATLALPSGQYIWSQVFRNYGAQYGRQLWGSVEFSSSRGFGTRVLFSAEFPLWFTSAVRPELFDSAPSSAVRSQAFADMMQPGRFMVHALATTPYVDVVDSILRSRTSYSASESIGGCGVTALHLAAWRGPPEMVSFLARKFPEILFLKDESGDTPFDIAVHYSRPKVSAILMERLLDQLNPYSGDYIWGKHVMESIAPYLGAQTISSKPIGHLISLFSSIWWPRLYVKLYEQLNLPLQQTYLPLPKMLPIPSQLIELPEPLEDGEKWYTPDEEPKVTLESLIAMQREPKSFPALKRHPVEKQIEVHAYDADADEDDDMRHPESPDSSLPQNMARPVVAVSYPSDDDDEVQLKEVDPEDLARGYWLELATNTGQEPASFAAQDLNDRCGKIVDDFQPAVKLVIRILDFKAAVADLENLRAAVDNEVNYRGIQLVEFVNPVMKRRDVTAKLLQPLLGSAKASRSNGMNSYAIRDYERRRIEVYKVRYAYTQASYFPTQYFQLLFPLATFPLQDNFDVHAPYVEEICNSPTRKEHLQVDHWWLRIKSKSEMKSKKTAAIQTPPPPGGKRQGLNPPPVRATIGFRTMMPAIKLQPNIILGPAGEIMEEDLGSDDEDAPAFMTSHYAPPRPIPPPPPPAPYQAPQPAPAPQASQSQSDQQSSSLVSGRSKRGTTINYAAMHNGEPLRIQDHLPPPKKNKPVVRHEPAPAPAQPSSTVYRKTKAATQPTRRSSRPPKPLKYSSEESSSSDGHVDIEDEAALALLGLPFNQ